MRTFSLCFFWHNFPPYSAIREILTCLSFLLVSLIPFPVPVFFAPFPHFLHSYISVTFHFSMWWTPLLFLLGGRLVAALIKPLFYKCAASGSPTVKYEALSSFLFPPCRGWGSNPADHRSFLRSLAQRLNQTHPAGIFFLLLVIRTFIISHMSRCVWCSPPSQTSKSFTPSLMSIRKVWSVWGCSTRS